MDKHTCTTFIHISTNLCMASYVFPSCKHTYLPFSCKYSFTCVLTYLSVCYLCILSTSSMTRMQTSQIGIFVLCNWYSSLLHSPSMCQASFKVNQTLKKYNGHALYTHSIVSWCLLQAHPSCSHQVWSLDKRHAHKLSACLRTRYVSQAQAMHVP